MSEDLKIKAGVAAVLSFLFNGLGQIFNGHIRKGLVIMTATSFSLILIIVGGILAVHWLITKPAPLTELFLGLGLFIGGVIGACIIGTYSIFDAYHNAGK